MGPQPSPEAPRLLTFAKEHGGNDDTRHSDLDGAQGAGEQNTRARQLSTMPGSGENRTETYNQYVEGGSKLLTLQPASSAAGVTSLAGQKGSTVRSPHFNFYHDEPLFGLDIGHANIKVMQLETRHDKKPEVLGYGISDYYPQDAVANGVIMKPDVLASALHELFERRLTGSITTRRVACTVPTTHIFSRPMTLPLMNDAALAEAVHLEAEQYIPMPADKLYLDYEVLRRGEQGVELLMVAAPKAIIDSHVNFLQSMNLYPVAIEPTMNAAARLFRVADPSHSQPSLLIDFGSIAVDIAVFDQTMFVNSTVPGGSETITKLLAQEFRSSLSEAYVIKSQHGLTASAQLPKIKAALQPMLDNLIREIRKMIRYYEERSAHKHSRIAQIILFGGGAIMPGLNDYLSRELKIPARPLKPWTKIDFGHLEPPTELASTIYITVAGLAILEPKEIFA